MMKKRVLAVFLIGIFVISSMAFAEAPVELSSSIDVAIPISNDVDVNEFADIGLSDSLEDILEATPDLSGSAELEISSDELIIEAEEKQESDDTSMMFLEEEEENDSLDRTFASSNAYTPKGYKATYSPYASKTSRKNIGDTLKVYVSGYSGLSWTTSNKKVATVKKYNKYGLITAEGEGTATIRGKKDGETLATVKVIVSDPDKLPAPTAQIDAVTNKAVSISFSEVSDAEGYYVYYSVNSTFKPTRNKIEVDADESVGYISGLTSGKRYYFWVAAYDSNGKVGKESTRMTTITGSVSLKLKNRATKKYLNDKKIYTKKASEPLYVEWITQNGNGTIEVKSYVMNSKTQFDSTDPDYALEYYYGDPDWADTFTKSDLEDFDGAIPFDYSDRSTGEYVKIWVGARDKNYDTNGVVVGVQLAIKLKKSSNKETKILDVQYWNQADSRWGNEYVNPDNTTNLRKIKDIGCALTCVAMVNSYRTGREITPLEQRDLSSFSGNNIYWTDFDNRSSFKKYIDQSIMEQIYNYIKEGKPVIVSGYPSKKGSWHYIVVTGYKNLDINNMQSSCFTINDPGDSSRTTLADFFNYVTYCRQVITY